MPASIGHLPAKGATGPTHRATEKERRPRPTFKNIHALTEQEVERLKGEK